MTEFTIMAVVSATVSAAILHALSAKLLDDGETSRAFLVYFIVAFCAALLTGFVEIPLTQRLEDRYAYPATYAIVPAAINLFAGRLALKIAADGAPPKTVRGIVLAFVAIKFTLSYFVNILAFLSNSF